MRSQYGKYSGVWLDAEICITEHVSSVKNNFNNFIRVLYDVRSRLILNLLIKIHEQYIQKFYQNGVLIWGVAIKLTLKPLEKQ